MRFGWSEEETAACFYPMHYEPKYSYPLLVWLHAEDENEKQIGRIMPLLSLRNFVAVAPRLAKRRSSHLLGSSRSISLAQREDLCFSDEAFVEAASDCDDAEHQILAAIRMARSRFSIHPDRIFVVGDRTSGALALKTAFANPDVFSAAASLRSGALPKGRLFNNLLTARQVPVFLALSGGEDSKNAEIESCETLRLLHSAGFQVTLRQYFWEREQPSLLFSDLNRWLMEIVSAQTTVLA